MKNETGKAHLKVGEKHLADYALDLLELTDEVAESVDAVQVDGEDFAGCGDQVESAGKV